MPGNNQPGETVDNVRVCFSNTLRLERIAVQIKQFCVAAVVLAKQLPVAFPHREIRQIIVAIKRIAVRRSPEIKRLMA